MAPRSFRQAAALLNVSDFSSGIFDTVLNPMWKTNRDRFPYVDSSNRISLRRVMDAWDWPLLSDYDKATIHPNFNDFAHWKDEPQGLAASPAEWAFASNDDISDPRVWRYELTEDVTTQSNLLVNGEQYAEIGSSYLVANEDNHLGGMDYHDGLFWVGTHYSPGGTGSRLLRFRINPDGTSPRIEFVDGTFLGSPSVFMPWISIVGISDLAFTSDFNGNGDALELHVYDVTTATWTPNGVVQHFDDFPLFEEIGPNPMSFQGSRIQGGDFSPNYHLYLVSDETDANGGGVYMFDLVSGCLVHFLRISKFQGIPESTGGQSLLNLEYQDVEIFDLEAVPHHSSVSGSIHIIVHDNDPAVFGGPDDVAVLHLEVPDPSQL